MKGLGGRVRSLGIRRSGGKAGGPSSRAADRLRTPSLSILSRMNAIPLTILSFFLESNLSSFFLFKELKLTCNSGQFWLGVLEIVVSGGSETILTI